MTDLMIAQADDREAFFSSLAGDAWHFKTSERTDEWWYFDALSDDGRDSLVIIFADNYVFSPRYIWTPAASRNDSERFPALTFIYSRDGKSELRTINEFTERQFTADERSAGCSIDRSSFRLEEADYGSGFVIDIDVAIGPNRRLVASFEWLSIESDLVPLRDSDTQRRSRWNLVSPRSDVAGKIQIVGRRGNVRRQYQFRGTGYHDHVSSNIPLHESTVFRFWGRAHFTDATAVFTYQQRIGKTEPEAKILIVRDKEIKELDAVCEERGNKREHHGIKYPARLALAAGDGTKLRIRPERIFDSSFYDLRMVSEMTLTLPDGTPHKMNGITEYLAPKNMKYRLFRWFADLKIGKRGKGPVF